MDLALPTGPASAADLERLDVDTALPLLVGRDDEILAFVAVGRVEGALYEYSPFGGWRAINEESYERDASLETRWIQARSDGITDPLPAGVEAVTDVEDARGRLEALLDGSPAEP